MKYSLVKFRNKLGKFFVPSLLIIFSILLFVILGSSVYQKKVVIQEGRLADKTVRANKTVEDTAETKAKRKLAAEAVTPEYTYQDDIAEVQHKRIEKLFKLLNTAKEKVAKEYQSKKNKAKKDEVVPQPTLDEKMASLKSQFEPLNQEEVTFFQSFPNSFYQNLFSLSDADLKTVEVESLKLVDDKMKGRIRDTELENVRKTALEQLPFLDAKNTVQQGIRYIVNLSIVANEFANEKKTEELRQRAMDDVQPVMIYQGEIIVREGTKVDENAMKKLKILGLINQNPSVVPMITLFLAIVLQIVMLAYFAKRITEEDKRKYFILFYTSFMLISVLLMKFFKTFQTEQLLFVPLFFPAAFTPLVLSYFVSRRSGILAAAFQVVFTLFVFYDSAGTNFLTICLVSYFFSGILATVLSRTRMSEQGASIMLWLIVFPVFLSFILMIYQGMSIFDGKTITAMICAVAGSVFSFIATIGLHPYIELLVTDDSMIVLNELSNPTHPLLKQLLEEAPGTYHHSMMVASLSANAVAEIGGQSLLTRVACYYHDIGKIKHANFFVENLPAGAENPHNFLLPEDSKQIIFGHVIDGAKILREYNMPQMIIDVCEQHHGQTLMKYFYFKEKERNPDVSEESYRYPGPKPQTREAGIVNIADTCEAAVRAMENPTNDKIKTFVHDVIQDRISDGQLDECGLTMKEIRMVEKSLVNGLCSTFHSRIKYPKMETEAKRMKEEQEKSGQ